MPDLGFIIPLNENDYLPFVGKPQGDRTNWCTSPPPPVNADFWTNENIQLSGPSPTDATVGQPVSIQVGVQAVLAAGGFNTENQVQHVQAWVCYPSTIAGAAGPLVPSMMTGPTPAKDLTGNPQVLFGSGQVGDYQNGAAYFQFTLDNPWTPTAQDIVPPNTTAHCCIIATCQGLADVSDGGGVEVGTFIPGNNLSAINICTDPHQGQRNITILPIGGKGKRLGDFGFLSGGVVRRERVLVEVTSVAQPNGVDPTVLGVLKAGPWKGLPLRPATSRPRGFGLRKNPHRCEGWLAKIICEAEEFIEELIAKIEGRPDVDKRGQRIALTLPPSGIHPLLFQTELNENDELGTVYVFDIVQTDRSGRRGGIRVGAVIVP